MRFQELNLRHRKIFQRYLGLCRHELATYSFENIYIWKTLFDIRWTEINEGLAVFFQDRIGIFLYLPVLSAKFMPQAVNTAFELMDKRNANRQISRIENVEQASLEQYLKIGGFEAIKKSVDFLYLRDDLSRLKGNALKSKRSSANYFIAHYNFSYQEYDDSLAEECLDLYELWARQRRAVHKDVVYQGMLEDSLAPLKVLLFEFKSLGCLGRVVRVDGQLKGFTFGFSLNPDTFCILYEVTDLEVKGLAQFIFREFCREAGAAEFINAMDDSGLENLKAVKLSYKPVKLVPSYIIRRKNG